MEFCLRLPITSTAEEQRMTVNEVKHQAKLAQWKEHILECRSQGLSVAEWCAQNGYHRTTYYKWEREIFGQISAANDGRRSKHLECTSSGQPEFAELPIEVSGSLALPENTPAREFHPAVVIRVGKIEVELSNSVSAGLMRQLKGLVDFAE